MQNTDKTLTVALLVSFAAHSFMFIPASHLSIFNRPRELTAIKITYLSLPKKNNRKTADSYIKADNIESKALKKVILPAANIDITNSQKSKEDSTPKIRAIEKAKTKADIDIKKSTASPDYQQLLKAKVKNYSFCPDSISRGKVNLSFTLSSDGQLKIIRIIEETSCDDHKLRLAAIECIKQANPFPPFPDSLKMREATFNVTISFMSK